MWLMLQQDKPEDLVIATGKKFKVRDLVRIAFENVGMEIDFEGEGQGEKGIITKCNNPQYNIGTGKVVLEIDQNYYRPTEVDQLVGDASKAEKRLKWKPKYAFESMIEEMISSDIKYFKKDLYLKEGGHNILNYNE